VLYTGILPKELSAHAASFFKRGWAVIDERPVEDVATVAMKEDMSSVSDPAFYKILLKNGEQVEAFCGREMKDSLCSDCPENVAIKATAPCSTWTGAEEEAKHPNTVFVTKDGRNGGGASFSEKPDGCGGLQPFLRRP